MTTLETLRRLTKASRRGADLRSVIIAFLCGGRDATEKRRTPSRVFFFKLVRALFFKLVDGFAVDGEVPLRLQINGRVVTLLMRKGNHADYGVGGEMVRGGYARPETTPTSIVDGGANIGAFTIVAHAWFPDTPIVCYEPDENNLKQLKRNLEANNVSANVIPKGLWSSRITLFYHPGDASLGYIDPIPSEYPIACEPPIIDDGCWLKLDVEGAEYEVIPLVLKQKATPSHISMEIHHNDTQGSALVRQIEDAGYVLLTPHQPTVGYATIEARRCS